MEYEELDKDDFDAMVTGELSHLAIWLEGEVMDIITDYFLADSSKRKDFMRLLLRRDGLTFQDKIEILRAMAPLFGDLAKELNLVSILNRVEEFKSFRNSFAHGIDSSGNDSLELQVETVGRSGKPKTITVTPESHRNMQTHAQGLLKELRLVRSRLAPNP